MRPDRSPERGFASPGPSVEHGFTPVRGSAGHGFTLIEVMVALAVFSLAALALVRLEGATIRSAGTLDRTLLAGTVARNVAIEAATDVSAPPPGVSQGSEVNGGARWNWTRVVAPTADARIVRISVAVAGPGGQVLARHELVRPPDPRPGVSVGTGAPS